MDKEFADIICHDFEEKHWDLAMAYLKKVHLNDVSGSEATLRSTRLAILALAKGRIYQMKDLVKSAKEDFRDVIMGATNIKKQRKLP